MKKITNTQRRWLLLLHILFAAIMFGVSLAFLILSLNAFFAKDEHVLQACFHAMLILAKTSLRASTIGTVVTGILLSVLTQWGLFRFYWIIAKELLTVVTIGIGIVGIYKWSLKAAAIATSDGLGAWHNDAFAANSRLLLIGIILQIISLLSLYLISFFKPWGKRGPKTNKEGNAA